MIIGKGGQQYWDKGKAGRKGEETQVIIMDCKEKKEQGRGKKSQEQLLG